MSRAHMLYNNEALSSLPVKITTWNEKWNPDEIFKFKSGNGLILEGVITSKSRHTVVDGVDNNLKFRYICLYVKISKAVRRKFDVNGKEIEPDFGSKKIALTGFLSSKMVSKEGDDVLTPDQTKSLLCVKGLEILKENSLDGNTASIWCEEKDLEGVELSKDSTVRLRTKGDGPYLESIVCLDEEINTKVNYSTGTHVGGSWTDKVLNTKDEKEHGAHLTEDSSGVQDDEWDD